MFVLAVIYALIGNRLDSFVNSVGRSINQDWLGFTSDRRVYLIVKINKSG